MTYTTVMILFTVKYGAHMSANTLLRLNCYFQTTSFNVVCHSILSKVLYAPSFLVVMV